MVTSPGGPPHAEHLNAARLWGVLASMLSVALAALSALALADVAHRQVARGVLVLSLLLAARALCAGALDQWSFGRAARVRATWRTLIVTRLFVPGREGERGRGDLSLAVDHAAEAPDLERLRAGAAASLLGVPVVFVTAGWLGLVIILGLLALAAPLYARAGSRSDTAAQRYRARRATLESRQLEILQHAPELRALGGVRYGADEIAALSTSEHALAMRAIRVALESSLVTEFLSGVSVGLVAMVVGFGLLDGRLSLVRALTAVLVTADLFAQIRRYGVEFHRRENAERARSALEVAPVVAAPRAEVLLESEDLVTEAHDEPVTVLIGPGDRVVVSGPSGAGKTSLLHTLVGWRAPRSGVVRRAHDAIGFVSAESALLSGSLRDNLTLGSSVSDDVVRGVLTDLGLRGERFVDLDVELISDGEGLSVGERVRVLVARAMLAHTAVLVLDDVAGVLDEDARTLVRACLARETELAVLEAAVDSPLLGRAAQRIELVR